MAERSLGGIGRGHCSVGMADYSTVPPPSSGSAGGGGGGGGGGGVNDAFKDALQRARQVSLDRAAGSRQLTVIGRWRSRPLLLRALGRGKKCPSGL